MTAVGGPARGERLLVHRLADGAAAVSEAHAKRATGGTQGPGERAGRAGAPHSPPPVCARRRRERRMRRASFGGDGRRRLQLPQHSRDVHEAKETEHVLTPPICSCLQCGKVAMFRVPQGLSPRGWECGQARDPPGPSLLKLGAAAPGVGEKNRSGWLPNGQQG